MMMAFITKKARYMPDIITVAILFCEDIILHNEENKNPPGKPVDLVNVIIRL
jgi:hypothetical protein